MSAQPEIRELDEQQAIVEQVTTGRPGIRDAFDGGFGRLFARLAELGVQPAAPPYARYLETGDPMSIEFGVPVATAGARVEEIACGGLPGGRAAVLRHVGPYEELAAACERLFAWVEANDEEPAGPFWESYVTDPAQEPDPARRITEICVPLR